MRSIILRFSDAELEADAISTVDAHNQIIQTSGRKATWWGWWKKKHEPFRADLLDYVNGFGRSKTLRIGLVNRKGVEKLYVATCAGCASSGGQPIPSPEPSLTPSYYSDAKFPAWFMLTEIEEIDKPRFIAEFGEVPSLDATLYEVVQDDKRIRIFPSRSWNLEPVKTQGDAVLHISDIHFGEGHGYPTSRGQDGFGIDVSPLCDLLVETIQKNVSIPIGSIVASGDFISKGDANSYPLATKFLDELTTRLGLGRSNCVVVPGNHDLWTLNTEHPTRTYEHELPYRTFLEGFHHNRIDELEHITRVHTPSGHDLVFVTLNSARIRADNLKEYGYVSRHRYEGVLTHLKRTLLSGPKGKTLVFVVLHHHIMPAIPVDVPDGKRPVSLTLDAGELIEEFCNAGVGYVLHGHQHMPFVGLASRISSQNYKWMATKNLFILGCGSTGAKRDWLPAEVNKNTFAVYVPQTNKLDVTFFEFLPQIRPSIYWSGEIPIQDFFSLTAAS